MDLLAAVRRTITRHALADAGTRVVLAVSGGADSVALASLAVDLERAGVFAVAGIVHFNHQLRPAAGDEETLCRSLAETLGKPFLAGRDDVGARARREHRSLEHAARRARYEFFARARAHFSADLVALGHTQDDQAETFLLRLIRGAGSRGLAAMYPRNGWIIRPLIDCRRADLRAYVAERGVAFADDESNADVSIPRNRIRAELLPLLEARFNPNIVETLASAAGLARDEWAWLRESADGLRQAALSRSQDAAGPFLALDATRLSAAPAALRRMVVWTAMTEAAGGRAISAGHVAAALRLMEERAGSFHAPGQRLERVGTKVVLRSRPPGVRGRWSATNLFSYSLSIPGEVRLPYAGCVVSAEPASVSTSEIRAVVGSGAQRSVALVRGDLCRMPLAVRNRRPGDRFSPAGLGREKKLQDFLMDHKVARDGRDRVPLVVDASGRIVWVAGYAIDRAFEVTDPAQGVLILRLRQLGGSA